MLVAESVLTFVAVSIAGVMLDTIVVGALMRAYQRLPLLAGAAAFALAGIALAAVSGSWRGPGGWSVPLRLERALLSRALRRVVAHPVVLGLAVLTLVIYAFRAWLSTRFPPTDWDSLMYHLIGPDHWVQSGSVGRVPESVWADSYPMGVESLAAWPMVFLKTAQYAPLAQLPCYFLGAAGVASIARRLGARNSHAVLAGLVFLLTPAVFAQANTGYVDAASAAFGLAALALFGQVPIAVRTSARPGRTLIRKLIIVSVLLGEAVAAKSSNLVLVGLIVPAAGYWVFRLGRRVSLGRMVVIGAAVALVLPALAVGGYWYLRTWVAHGNPLYPVTMLGFQGRGSVQDVVIGRNTPLVLRGKGALSQLISSSFLAFSAGDRAIPCDERLGALGMAWVLFVLPAAVAGLVLWHRDRRRRGPGYVIVLVALAVFLCSPAAWWGRYVLLGFGALLPLAAYALTGLTRSTAGFRRVAGWAVQMGLAACLAVTAWWGHQYLSISGPIPRQSAATNPERSGLSLAHTLQLSEDPQRGSKVGWWRTFRPVLKLPKGTAITLVSSRDQAILHPMVGMHLEHSLVVIEDAPDAQSLMARMAAARSGYVLIDDSPAARSIGAQVAADKIHFRRMYPVWSQGVLYQLLQP